MKISLLQLEMVLSKMKYSLVGFADGKDLELDISLIEADPGTGQMVDAILIKAQSPSVEGDEKEMSMNVELYDPKEQQLPRASKTEHFKIDKKY